MNKFSLYILLSLLLLNACSKNKDEISTIKESRQDLEMISAYLEGMNL